MRERLCHVVHFGLYQLHWPERHTNFFGTLAYGNQQAENDYDTTPLEAIWVLNTYKFTDT
jgi:hypothetical protein